MKEIYSSMPVSLLPPREEWSAFAAKSHQDVVRLAWVSLETIQSQAFVPSFVEGLGKVETITC